MEPLTAGPVTVAAVQAAPVLLDRDATIGKVVALTEQAAAQGARLVVFPEAFVPGYPDWVWRTRPWTATLPLCTTSCSTMLS
jgi:nitrilase